MKCPNCGVENHEGAKFCRNCGCSLGDNRITIRKRFPQYDFLPTTRKRIHRQPSYIYFIILLLLAFFLMYLISGAFLLFFSSDEMIHHDGGVFLFCIVIGTPPAVMLMKRLYKKTFNIDLSSMFDYIENRTESAKYRFVVKDSKFGLFNLRRMTIQIPCEYDCLSWITKDEILNATSGDHLFEIDINGNRLK